MPCPACQTPNPPEARFCQACGAPQTRRCAGCGADLPAGARFCMACGQPAAAPAAADQDRLARVAASAPRALAEKMRAATLSGERRVVTVLFADVVGSTSLAERMDPEDWTRVMNGAFDHLCAAVYRYEGTIARLMGDAILAFFGAPVAHEDDPARAAHAALDLLAAARAYAEETRRRDGIDFAVRVGLNTGAVVVGAVGSDLVYEYTAMGDAVNLAARMQTAARPGTVLVAEPTHRHIAPLFECLERGTLEVKGRAEPVRAYEVLAPRARPEPVRGVRGLSSDMVGRDAEFATLRDAAAVVQAGLGRAALVAGEPGLGKSRLVAEARATLAAPAGPFAWYEGRCLSYGQSLPYHLVLDLLRSLLGVPAAAPEAETRAALRREVERALGPAGAADVVPYLAHLLALPLDAADQQRVQGLHPEALLRLYTEALRRLLAGLAAHQPVALVLDDIHWADPTSVEVLARVAPLAGEAPLLLCLVTRPDRDAPGWKLVSAVREALGPRLAEISIGPLTAEHSRQLLANLLAFDALPERLRRLILAKAEGNPFFVEEVVRMLIERGVLARQGERWVLGRDVDSLDIPDNLQGLLLARIDRLPDDVKRTLRVAAVIGRQFPVRVLEQVVGR